MGHKSNLTQLEAERFIEYVVPNKKEFTGKVLLEENPQLRYISGHPVGKLWMDGYGITVTPQTKFSFASTSNLHHDKSINANMWIGYNATPLANQSITANSLTFAVNNVYPQYDIYNHADAFGGNYTKIEAPDYSRRTPGLIRFNYGQPIEIIPDQRVQESVSTLGMTLIPSYQMELPDSDATKVNFRFYVVQSSEAIQEKKLLTINGMLPFNTSGWSGRAEYSYNKSKLYNMIDNTIAMQNGVILIPDRVLSRLHDRAQLAALLSYSITSILQNQIYNAFLITESTSRYDILHRFNEMLQINEQTLRIGIRQMYLAGYDISEAPFAWAVAQGKPANNPVIDSKHPDKEIPWYAAYAFNYISHYYSDVDYSKLKRGEKEYQQFLQELYKADPSLPHPKVAAAATSAAATK
jgi:hypothetical protein